MISYVKEKDCLGRSEISEKIIRSTYFVNAKSWFVIVNNKFCPQQNAIAFSDKYLKEEKHCESAQLKILHQ